MSYRYDRPKKKGRKTGRVETRGEHLRRVNDPKTKFKASYGQPKKRGGTPSLRWRR